MTKKLTLDLDTLSVDSFPTTAPPEEPRGTVRGAEFSGFTCRTCGGQPTCGSTCLTSCVGGGPCTCYPV